MFITFSIPTSSPRSSRLNRARACDRCRALKVKCREPKPGAGLPAYQTPRNCTQCTEDRFKCTYLDRPARRGRPSKRTVQGHSEEVTTLCLASGSDSMLPGHDHYRTTVTNPSPNESLEWDLRSPCYETTVFPVLGSKATLSSPSGPSPQQVGQALVDGLEAYDVDVHADDAYASSFRGEAIQIPDFPSHESVWATIDEFFDTTYVVFPIVSYVDLAARIVTDPNWGEDPGFRTLILSLRLLNAAASYRMSCGDKELVCRLIHQVEAARMMYDFSDPSTLDAVTCTLFLFVAYNVLDKHARAFLYLDEALTLFESGLPFDHDEEWRTTRIGQVLFNTEAATMALYKRKGKRTRALKPSPTAQCTPRRHSHEATHTSQVADRLLDILTQINLADDSEGLAHILVGSPDTDLETEFSATGPQQHQYSRIQAADVLVTRQWQISSKLAQGRAGCPDASPVSQVSLESIGVTAMSWICTLKDGELRIIGLGKLAELAQNIGGLAIRGRCQNVIHGLAGAIMREDHERQYASSLASLFQPLSLIPQMSLSQNHSQSRRCVTLVTSGTSFGSFVTELVGPDLFDSENDWIEGSFAEGIQL